MIHAVLPVLLLAAAPPQDWPQFLGPDRTGVVAASDWSATGADAPLWEANLGLGYSCPSIVGDRLVTMGYQAELEQDVVWCLDPATGEELWVYAYAATDDPSYHGGGTLTTPTIADSIVYTVNRHGHALALDLETGEPLWERDYLAELGTRHTFHGFCASPVVVGDRILYVFGGVALAAKRDGGDILWRTEDEGDGAYANPTVFELGGRTLAAAMLGQILFVLDVESGDVVHRMEWPLQGNAVHVAQPLVFGDRLLVSTAYGKGAAMLRLGGEVEPEVLWTSRRLRNKVTGVYLHDEHLYGFDESMLKCFDLDGNELWRERGLGMGALSIVGGRLLVLSSNGELIVAEATPEEFRELSRRKVLDGGSYWTMPVFSDGLIYVRNSLGDLACLDHRSSASVARDEAAATATAAPTATELFAHHDALVGGEAIRAAPGLRLVGHWEILGRGMSQKPASLVIGRPNAWRLGLDAGDLVQVFDGELGWEQKNGGYRLLDELEMQEAPRVFALDDLLAPACPASATVSSAPVTFSGTRCWRVDAPGEPDEPGEPGTSDGEPSERGAAHYYFDVESGKLVAREHDGLATLVLHGALDAGDARVPERLVVYRSGSGQEETFYVSGAEWIAPSDALFARPPGVLALIRTPEQRAEDTRRLRERYAAELGSYRPDAGDGVLFISVEDGDLVGHAMGERTLITPVDGEDGAFLIVEFRGVWRFVYGEDGAVTGGTLTAGPRTMNFVRVD